MTTSDDNADVAADDYDIAAADADVSDAVVADDDFR